MIGRFLLDTNIVIALFAETKSVLERLVEAEEVFVAAIVLGELQYGAHKSERIAENIAKIDQFAQNAAVLACDAGTARHYGAIKNHLRARGEQSRRISRLNIPVTFSDGPGRYVCNHL